MESRQQKIENLLKLIKGEINPDDLKPKRLCMAIGYGSYPFYTVNEKQVSEDEFNKTLALDRSVDNSMIINVIYSKNEQDI